MPEETPVEEPVEATPDPLVRVRGAAPLAAIDDTFKADLQEVLAIGNLFVQKVDEKIATWGTAFSGDLLTLDEQLALKAESRADIASLSHRVKAACTKATTAVAPPPEPEELVEEDA